MKIGIFGGTYNPVHRSHIDTALLVYRELQLDKLLMIVASDPPHKKVADGVSAGTRLKMVDLSIQGLDGIVSSDMEIRRGGKSYTLDTLLQLKKIYPDDELYLTVGSDMLQDLPNWHEVDDIFGLCTVVAVPRAGYEQDDRAAVENLKKRYGAKVIELHVHLRKISSTCIRRLLKEGRPITGLVEESVEQFIYESGIYFPEDVKEIQKRLRETIDPERYRHTMAVVRRAADLAERYGMDPIRVRTAALLHDCAKSMDKQKLLLYSGEDEFYPNVVHATGGGVVAMKKFGIRDEGILRAIRQHCTGDAGMDDLSKLIYLADMSEYTRDYPCVDEIRNACDISLDEGMRISILRAVRHLEERNLSIHPATIRALHYYTSKEASS